MVKELSPIIAPEEVTKYLDSKDVVIVDARGGTDAYDRFQRGHLNGAVFLDLETQLSQKGPDPAQGGRHPLPSPEIFGATLGAVRISPTTHVLVYDDKNGANAAARFWWMMRAAGHQLVQVIDGGLTALAKAGLPITKGPQEPFPSHKPYPLRGWELPMADLNMVDESRSSSESLVIDVREAFRYKGESEPIDQVAGHIPGAINCPYIDNLDREGRFLPPEVLASKYQQLIGKRNTGKVIVHCGSGVTACHTLLAMEYAGLKGAHLYPGSWSEWSRRGKPIGKASDA